MLQASRVHRRASVWLLVWSLVVAWVALPAAAGAQPVPPADPGEFGLIIPNLPPKPGAGRRAVVSIPGRDPQVGNVFLEVGERFIVEMPDGRLVSVSARDATITDRPFEPAVKKQLGNSLVTNKFPGFKSRETKHYLYIYDTSEPFFAATSRILETMYPALVKYCQRQGIEVHPPAAPLVILMFRTEQDFQNYHRMPEGVAAYYSGVTNQVVMYEQSALGEISPELAFKQAVSTIAHEGVHQILHNIGVQQRLSRWPMWISEGLPEYFAPTQMDRRVRWKGVGLVNDLRMMALIELMESRAENGEQPGELLGALVTAQTLDSDGYAVAWGLTHFLAERRKQKFFNYLQAVSAIQPLQAVTPEMAREQFEQHFGANYAQLEADMFKHLKGLPYVDPVSALTHYVGMLQINRGGVVQRQTVITASPAAIRKWREEMIAGLPLNVRAGTHLNIQAFQGRGTAEQFAERWRGGR